MSAEGNCAWHQAAPKDSPQMRRESLLLKAPAQDFQALLGRVEIRLKVNRVQERLQSCSGPAR
jgi:hypothetical protein